MGLKDRLRKAELSIANDGTEVPSTRRYCSLKEAMSWVLITMSDEHDTAVENEVNKYLRWLKKDP
ncbi:MAG TPA: hypothetical protein VF717_12375, partial [Pyrinomonadaceae bacterium]